MPADCLFQKDRSEVELEQGLQLNQRADDGKRRDCHRRETAKGRHEFCDVPKNNRPRKQFANMPKLPPGDTDRPEQKGAKHPMGPALVYMKAVSPPNVRIQDIYVGILPFAAL